MESEGIVESNVVRVLLLLVFLCLFIIAYGYRTNDNPNQKDFSGVDIISTGVEMEVDGEKKIIERLPYCIKTGKPFKIKVDLKYSAPIYRKSIAFYIDSLDCTVMLGDSVVRDFVVESRKSSTNNRKGSSYKSNIKDNFFEKYYFDNISSFMNKHYNFSGGSANFVILDFPYFEESDVMTIEFKPKYKGVYSYNMQPFYVGYRTNLILYNMHNELPILVTGFTLLVLTMISFFVSFSGTLLSKKNMQKMFYIALSALLVTIYSLSRAATILYFLSGYRMLLHWVEYISLMMVTYPMLRLVYGRTNNKFELPIRISIFVVMLNFFVQLVSIFIYDIDFQHMLYATHVVVILTLLLVMASIIFSDSKKYNEKNQLMLSIAPLFLGGMYGFVKFYENKGEYFFDEFSWCLLFYSFVQIYFLGKFYKHVQEDNARNKFFEEMASVDTMTKHKNRYSFERHIENIRKNPKKVTIITVDLNNLKYINDTMGHAYGDIAIKSVADFLQQYIMDADVYRTGGDEFIVIKSGEFTYEEYMSIKDRHLYCDAPNGGKMELFFAIGYEVYNPETGVSIEEVMRISDKKMYKDKKQNKI